MYRLASGAVRSADGTRIAYDRLGDGPPLILIDPAGHHRGLTKFAGLARLLAPHFTVFTYDRRGRGESSDTPPYAPEREVEDLEALIADAGGSAAVYGYSSGALLALHAAARLDSIPRLALLEPPLQDDDAPRPDPLTAELEALIAEGRRSDAVARFHESIGVPDEFVEQMRSSPAWAKWEAVAPTLVYDCKLSDATDSALLESVEVPALVLDSEGSGEDLTGWAATVASRLPNATHRSLAGEWHVVADETLAPVLIEFFGSA
jgi:pimeloyl-ACP methyl ester carboxylesterase